MDKKFKFNANKFKVKFFSKSKKVVYDLSRDLENKLIWDKSIFFIKGEASKIYNLLTCGNNPAIIHKIRMHLKSLGAITTLLYKINPTSEFKKILKQIKKYGTLIGDWHDRIVLVSSLERFIIKTDIIDNSQLISLIKIINQIKKDNQLFYNKINSSIEVFLKEIQYKGFGVFSGIE